jgi:hypothetical protein
MRSRTADKAILIGTFLCASIHVLRVYLRGFIEDPDIGTFILMSQSFWSGDTLYDQFFDPKLPHILPIYSLSLLSGSIGGHLLITLLCICTTGVVTVLSGKNVWGGVLYICLTLLSPGGATGHLAVFANFLIACSYYSLRRYRYIERDFSQTKKALGWLIVSSVLAGWAIGLRPNYGFALIPLSIWFIWQRKLHIQRALVWLVCCLITILTPIFVVVRQADIDFMDLLELLRSWNNYFYTDVSISGSFANVLQMYMHPIGPFTLGLLVIFVCFAVFFSASREELEKVRAFAVALTFLWISHFISHSYNHYVLMDLMIISLLISSVELKTKNMALCTTIALLWFVLLFSPSNPHSESDSLVIENRRKILSWIDSMNSTQVVSPTWLTPHWTTKGSPLPTKGIHPEWSIGLLDRYSFKDLEIVKKLGLSIDWTTQCKNWEDNASIFISSQKLYDRCRFSNFKEVNEFRRYPLRVWTKQD